MAITAQVSEHAAIIIPIHRIADVEKKALLFGQIAHDALAFDPKFIICVMPSVIESTPLCRTQNAAGGHPFDWRPTYKEAVRCTLHSTHSC